MSGQQIPDEQHLAFDTVVEAGIGDLGSALARGEVTSVELVARYLNRIAAYDRSGPALNAVPVLNPAAFAEARASDLRRAEGRARGPLDGIPFTAKDSYKVRGLPVASGSPAFEHLIANEDAFVVARLRAEGAVLLGLTNMPPLANGGMQRGVYGRAESPYNGDFMTSAYGSGSSNGSGTATAASFAAFGLGEETWSSGRAPASNNALVAYTPSRGIISVRGNWPLVPTMDVIVPHTRTVTDLLHVLDAVVRDDSETTGDLWREQPWIALPSPSDIRPESFAGLATANLTGMRLGVPRLYINGAPDYADPILTRPSIMVLWQALRDDLERVGAEVVEVDFPVVENYERVVPGSHDLVERGILPEAYLEREIWDLSIRWLDDFLIRNGQEGLDRLAEVPGELLAPAAEGSLPDRFGEHDFDIAEYVPRAAALTRNWQTIPTLEEGFRGLERAREVDFEQWLDAHRLDAVIFPTAADIAPSDADVNPDSADIAWRNGVRVANGNLVPRHLGIPTVTVPMGTTHDLGMPVGVTIAGKAYSDVELIRLGAAVEQLRHRRSTPPRTPVLPDEPLFPGSAGAGGGIEVDGVTVGWSRDTSENVASVRFSAEISGETAADARVYLDGLPVDFALTGSTVSGSVSVPVDAYSQPHSQWREPYGPLVTIVVHGAEGSVAGAFGTPEGRPL